jgi:hypothetical protein
MSSLERKSQVAATGNRINALMNRLQERSGKPLETKKQSNLIGLSDATGSMDAIWQTTNQQIKEMVKRLSDIGSFQLKWVA